jgi:hypothetical protein
MSESTQYFRKFPITVYRGQQAVNILRRVDFNSNIKNFLTAFYAHTMESDDKIENISFDYYDDVDLDWVLYHVNDIIDPHYDVPLSYNTFDNFIVKKYDSLRRAQREIIHYKNNYESDDSIISTGAYQSLNANIKKYYKAVMSYVGVAGYERAPIDFVFSTNFILSADITNIQGQFIKNEVITKNNDSTNIAQVAWISDTGINLQHVRGGFFSESNYAIKGERSGATATVIAASVKKIVDVIPEEEVSFYKPISLYENEEKKNESKRDIYLVDSSYITRINKQLTDIMK